MPNFLNIEPTPYLIDDIMRSRSRRFIDQQRPIQIIKLTNHQQLTDALTHFPQTPFNSPFPATSRAVFKPSRLAPPPCRCTESGVPGILAPAAAGCPPPPNCAAISFTFTNWLFDLSEIRV